jgi:hypothetical protein
MAPDPDVIGFVLMSVTDTGGGIAPEEFAGCYDPFGLNAGQAPRRFRLGVGLALVRAVAETLGGEIDVSSNPTGGSRIGLRIPVWGSRAARITEAQVELAGPGDLSDDAWVCRACGEKEIATFGEDQLWHTLSPGESLAISEDPPAACTRLGRVGELRQAGALLSVLQPRLRLHEVAPDEIREAA